MPLKAGPDEEANPGMEEAGRTRRGRPAAIALRFRPGIVYPLVAAVAYSTADLLVKSGLGPAFNPAFGAMVSLATGLFVWSAAHALEPVRRRFRIGPDVGWLVLSGVLMGAAILLLFNALDRADVSLIVPVVATQPLFVFVFSTLALRHLEQLERSTIVAGVMVVLGTILVST